MSDFLFRMIERAAGSPAAGTAPQPPRQFYWPAPLQAVATWPAAPGASPVAISPAGRRAPTRLQPPHSIADVGPAPSQVGESKVLSGRTRENLFGTSQYTESGPGEERTRPITETGAFLNPSQETRLAGVRDVVTDPTPVDIAPEAPTPPTVRALPKQENDDNAARPDPSLVDLDQAPESRMPPRPSEDSEISASVQAHTTLVVRDARASNENRPALQGVETRSGLPKQMPTGIAQMRSRRGEPEPPVEVKIGTVEIRFDPPPAHAAEPAPARPVGVADFADLRRYAARPWPLRSR